MGATTKSTRLYRHTGTALLRAAAVPLPTSSLSWPDLTDTTASRAWLEQVWDDPRLAEAVRQASPSLEKTVADLRSGHPVRDKKIRSASLSTARYLLRSIGRPTPFGLFAGVAPVRLGPTAQVSWGRDHRAAARVNTEWLIDIIGQAESCPELLDRLFVVLSDLAHRRGQRLEIPRGPNRVTLHYTRVIAVLRDRATTPIRFAALVDMLAEEFATDRDRVRSTLTELVKHGCLITNLRAPFTITDPLAHVVDQLREAGADTVVHTAPLVSALEDIQTELQHHNHPATTPQNQRRSRAVVTSAMRELSRAGRMPLALDLLLDCQVQLPRRVAHEMERAASALLRLTRQPTGEKAWYDYHAAFVERYGTGTLVPLTDVLNPDSGLGYPAGYSGSVFPPPEDGSTARDERLLSMVWQAVATGGREIILTDTDIDALNNGDLDPHRIPPHVELSARVHAADTEALSRGDFLITVAPARSAGTLTSRFTPIATGFGLAEVYRALPCSTKGALRAQMSFGPLYAHAENVCRVPAYLDHLLPLGQYPASGDGQTPITVDDLAVTATSDRLHLVSLTHRRVVEPQVFHALALDKQAPLLARFLAHLPRAGLASWYQFDWGPHATLPFLPQVRYRRTILSPAQWRLTRADLPPRGGDWESVLDQWRQRWNCPNVVELREADRTLRLTLQEPTHASLLHAHLRRHGQAILYQATPVEEYGWLDGHAHEIALPLAATSPVAPNPLCGPLPTVTNAHGQLPGAAEATWLSAKLFTHPERMTEIVTEQLPALLAELDSPPCWWLRYRNPRETDHLRIRIRTSPDRYGRQVRKVAEWAHRLRRTGVAGTLSLDTYSPEIGRYGADPSLSVAEEVFVADAELVAALLRQQATSPVDLTASVVANMVAIVTGFHGDPTAAMNWLAKRPVPTAPAIDRKVADEAIRISIETGTQPRCARSHELDALWQRRADALKAYCTALSADTNTDTVVESLLHMHHNRAVGIAPEHERTCRRLARQASLSWLARQGSGIQ
ncbi:lantibiotic dehydratase [Thermobifida halotolerans]|uniref:Lantibiotic dehydratase n=1 Tax=Thermobifida halotolerans TaxID=483545 RepID=A0A399FWW1_9ACTN|nr:lantibiotic dehydratase [Thermobifida halotolerans]UOE21375.1 lantibiotic dehydratase [Thermobifida halotolerans]